MTKGRDIPAESISRILEMARVQRRSGLLQAEHSQGLYLEEGELYVLAGAPIYARAGELTGDNALTHLLSWHNIYFSFASNVSRPIANLSPVIASRSIAEFEFIKTMTGPLIPPSLVAQERQSITEHNPSRHPTRRLSGIKVDGLVPQKIGPERNVLSLPLTRRQRFVYFLIDGRRTIGDLARCTNKAVPEVEQTLGELNQHGLIEL